jgi:hypothetical protein
MSIEALNSIQEGNKRRLKSGNACYHSVRNPLSSSSLSKNIEFNPFQSNFSANRILPSSYLFWAVKRLVDYL